MEESNFSPGRRVKTRQKSQLEPSADGAPAPGAGYGATTRLLRTVIQLMKTPKVKLAFAMILIAARAGVYWAGGRFDA